MTSVVKDEEVMGPVIGVDEFNHCMIELDLRFDLVA